MEKEIENAEELRLTPGLAHIPSVDRILLTDQGRTAVAAFGHKAAVGAVRAVLADERCLVRGGKMPEDGEALAAAAMDRLNAASASSLKPVYNLTGTILHTNLGRAQLPEQAVAAAVAAMRNAVTLEYDVESGERGERDDHVKALICELTGAEDATLVNNNAAAVLLALNTLAGTGKGAIISRGQLIEIGGAFRMPDIMARAGVKLVEVGTTNRTHPADYRNAIDETTGVILKVHPSNYRIEGFSKTVATDELAQIAASAGVPLVEDLGSGTLVDLSAFGLKAEPTVQQVVRAGADLVTFSGDKLLGGVQAGFIVGKAAFIAAINRNPLKRSLRVDKIRLAAMAALLQLYRYPERLYETVPTLRFLARPLAEIVSMAEALAAPVQVILGADFVVCVADCRAQAGSGASPAQTLPSAGLAIRTAPGGTVPISTLAARLRALPVPVIGHISNQALVLDLRTLEDSAAFIAVLQKLQP